MIYILCLVYLYSTFLTLIYNNNRFKPSNHMMFTTTSQSSNSLIPELLEINIQNVNTKRSFIVQVDSHAKLAQLRQQITKQYRLKNFKFLQNQNNANPFTKRTQEIVPIKSLLKNNKSIFIQTVNGKRITDDQNENQNDQNLINLSESTQMLSEDLPKLTERQTTIIQNHSIDLPQNINFFQVLEEEWICPISQNPIVDPVITQDGQLYEKSYITKWLATNSTSPATGGKLKSKAVIPDIKLKNVILKYNNFVKNFSEQHQEKMQNIQDHLQQQIEEKQEIINVLEKSFSTEQESQINSKQIKLLIQNLRYSLKKLQITKDQKNFQFYPELKLKAEQIKQNAQSFKYESQKQVQLLTSNRGYLSIVFPKLSQREQCYRYNPEIGYYSLNLNGINVNMQNFITYNWSMVYYLNLSSSGIDDVKWNILARNAHLFVNLKSLEITKNIIRNVTIQQLQGFKKLKYINFALLGKYSNPLTIQSRRKAQIFKQLNPQINVYF